MTIQQIIKKIDNNRTLECFSCSLGISAKVYIELPDTLTLKQLNWLCSEGNQVQYDSVNNRTLLITERIDILKS